MLGLMKEYGSHLVNQPKLFVIDKC